MDIWNWRLFLVEFEKSEDAGRPEDPRPFIIVSPITK
jgi:hypothetical protein